MNRKLLTSACVALALAAIAAPARADLVPWEYSFTPGAPSVSATTGVGSVGFSSVGTTSITGDTSVVASNLSTASTELAASPATFSGVAYTLSMYLKDVNSGQDTTLTFSGFFDGTVSATSASVNHTFTGSTTQVVTLGANEYTVTIGSYLAPGAPTTGASGAIGGTVVVETIKDGGVPNNVPEPSALILAGLGASSLLALRYRRRKAAVVPA